MSRIVSTGSYLPRTVVDDDAFADERFRLRSGSARRHHAAADETAIMMATAAATQALDHGGISGADVDLIIGYSGMPDFLYPKDTNVLIRAVGAHGAAAWTLDTACASAISALSAADALLQAGRFKTALIVQTMNWVNRGIDQATTDFSSLGDGASAMVVQASDHGGLVGVVERTDPDAFDFVQLPSPFATGEVEHIEFSHDPRYRGYFGSTVLGVVAELFEQTNLGPDDVDWFVPHQVGPTLLQVWCDQLGIGREKLLHTFAETANMSAVNVPHILDVNLRAGRIKPGDRLLLFAPGAGMHLAAMLWQV